jgi:peptidoglycan/LPS O-acetylase OafA/YrhL
MVVAFHAGLPVPGGFVGVDVFFVISGFVITAMLRREFLATGRIRFGRFYFRRFKRLIPALAVVVSFTALASAFLLSPFGLQQIAGRTGAAAITMTANIIIALGTGGYFDAPAEANPLLNTWSLSVEEQFYLVFPLTLAIAWLVAKKYRHVPLILVSMIAVSSFGLAIANSAGFVFPWRPYLFGFYGPFTRAWEFAAGSILCLATVKARSLSSRHAAVCGLAGAGLLVTSLFLITGATPFPGWFTLLPVTGTMLLIHAGTSGTNRVSAALATKPMVKVGDWSYSIYLWHWPLIALATQHWPQWRDARLAAAALALVPAIISYRWVETPMRAPRSRGRYRWALLISSVVLTPFGLAKTLEWTANHYWTPKLNAPGTLAVAHRGDIGHDDFFVYLRQHSQDCEPKEIRDQATMWKGVVQCRQTRTGEEIDLALIGDSHAEHLYLGLAELLPHKNIAYYTSQLPIRNTEYTTKILDHVIHSAAIKTVIISPNWDAKDVPPELVSVLRELTHAGKTVYLADDVPSFPFDPSGCKYQGTLQIKATGCMWDSAPIWQRHAEYFPQLETMAKQVPGVYLLQITRDFCDRHACHMALGDDLLFRDRNHLNINGSRYIARRILEEYPALRTPTGAPG